ncbi:Leucine-rich repeat-containing protein 53 [Heterocephalus glaber]|uniref:Leucine-rich repeat-containing protein 53 n=1 Tax=Heterocephalus glaber TaxID=10181 RepID=G5AQ91_HETGA|nr:Leucine-rich repeat-containing protein 53 [Heterocephalus glaber]
MGSASHTEGGWLILFAITLRLVAACPPSCVVCARDVTLCHQLTYVLAAPETTRVLVITDGHLSSVDSTNLSLLFNLALLSLSRNGIKEVEEDALYGPTKLRTLLLGHNRISSSSLADHTFGKLRHLQVLVLSSNTLRSLRGAWFRNTRALTRLQLDGNQITNLTDSSFAGTNLHRLRHLDLSNNFISYIEKDAFRSLSQLQEVDLSRNRLAHMPDVFTPLKQLSLLSLDSNQWSCTCDLHPLARFLRNYIKSSAHTLRNTMDITCRPSTPSVATQSVLRLSETNCDSKAPNLTLVLKDGRSRLPGQDVALLTMLGFAGAVGLTCLGLVVFNWKLRQGKPNEHTSENLCCRTFNESLCAHEARNYLAKGYCNCHLTQENEIKVMSTVGPGKEMPLLQENSHQATLASESTAPDASFRNLKGKDSVDSAFFCLDRRLLQSGCSEPPGKREACNDVASLTKYCPKSVEKLRSLKLEEAQSQALSQLVTRTTGQESKDEIEDEELDTSFNISALKLPICTSSPLKYAEALKEKQEVYFPALTQPFSIIHPKPLIKKHTVSERKRREIFSTQGPGIKFQMLNDVDKYYVEQKKLDLHKEKVKAVARAQAAQERIILTADENLNKKKCIAQKMSERHNKTIQRGMVKIDRLNQNETVLKKKKLIQEKLKEEKYQKILRHQVKEYRTQEIHKRHCEEKFVLDIIAFQKTCERLQDVETKVATVRANAFKFLME